MKSECSSANRACFCRAASSRSAGRSRGSGIDSAAASTSTSRTQPSASACQDHPAEPRVDGQLREPAADVGDRAVAVEGAEFLQQQHAVADAALVGRIEEREVLDVAELQRRHLQDHRGEVGPQDLGVGEARPRLEVLLGVQPDAHAGRDAPRAARPLRGRGLRDRLDRQPLHLGPAAVARDARGAGVDDVADAGHGQRRLGDVGGQHDSAAGVRLEDLLLLGRRQPGVERQHLGVLSTAPRSASAVSRISRSPDRNTSTSPGGSAPARRWRRRSPRSGRASRCGRSRGRGRRDRRRPSPATATSSGR